VGSAGSGTQSVGGGSSTYQSSDPTVYRGPATIGATPPWPWLVAVLLLLIPVAWLTVSAGRRRGAGALPEGSSESAVPSDPSTSGRDGSLDLEQ
jgi:hypothetical protein